MISYEEFTVLRAFSQADLPIGEDGGNVNDEDVIQSLQFQGLLNDGKLTSLGQYELEKYRVASAVILAAGSNDINAKSVYSMPKGLLVKDGETLIERQIRQLKEVGITRIVIIIAYKQELFFHLREKWDVELEINPDIKSNNIVSLAIVKDLLSNTYVLNSDNYFPKNPFHAYEYCSFHATVYKADARNELLVDKNSSGRITRVYSGAPSGECLYGHAFFDKRFSETFRRCLEKDKDDFRLRSLFWEEFVQRHISELDIFAKPYGGEEVLEFDSIQEMQDINGLFLDSVSKRINETICKVLKCSESDVSDIHILEKGLTNILFTFVVRGERYIFRFPGDSSKFFIYRKNECVAQKIAASCGADGTYVYIDETGAKISRFRENCIDLHGRYYRDIPLMKQIARKIRLFHDAGRNIPNAEQYNYDPVYQCERLFAEASKIKGDLFGLFADEWAKIRKLQQYADADGIPHTMCHNDINIDNVLMTEQSLDIIDWEFAGFNDPGYDFGRVIAGLEYEADDPRIDEILEAYFDRPATPREKLHWLAYSCLHNWYYVGWALYKESINESSRDWMLYFYKQSQKLLKWCLEQYVLIR